MEQYALLDSSKQTTVYFLYEHKVDSTHAKDKIDVNMQLSLHVCGRYTSQKTNLHIKY